MIAPHAEVRFGFRPLPSQDIDSCTHASNAWPRRKRNTAKPSAGRPCRPATSPRPSNGAWPARDLADALGLPIGNAVDFWTEASLFSQAGLTAIVFGPGDIAQAHTADEWVSLEQLASAAQHYQRLLA